MNLLVSDVGWYWYVFDMLCVEITFVMIRGLFIEFALSSPRLIYCKSCQRYGKTICRLTLNCPSLASRSV